MPEFIRFLDAVAVTEDIPSKNLRRGQVGTVKDMVSPGVYEVDFSDLKGHVYATAEVQARQLMLLYFEPAKPPS